MGATGAPVVWRRREEQPLHHGRRSSGTRMQATGELADQPDCSAAYTDAARTAVSRDWPPGLESAVCDLREV